ncbi:ATP-binding cassette subfamily B protein [Pullulanibacillus pueri]|uniref:ABC transporter ATP-binding protein n=1 Tax=Pullulanibacillus pueri TaxID=1437324 RepID=A0A8J2ZT48_9BACL|nr:ABC transporter transmembrane domain-containing protein [Pullulanibacillus pueri]MBM7681085.1 ATP-binding cassette subfamily B protein [Pullulanibacillus pueri]GGH76989.1 ABC transporter ATP-binding protein [Pullulanibacillus pueri]
MNESYPKENLARKKVFRRLLSYTKPHKKQLAFAFLILFLATGADLLGPYIAKVFIDDYLTPRHFAWQSLTGLGIIFVLLYIGTALFHYLQIINFQTVALKIIQQLRVDVFNKVQHLGLSFFDKTPGGSLISRITNDTEAIKELFVTVLATLVQSSVMLIGIFIAMFALNVKVASFCLILLPLLFVLMYGYKKLSAVVFRTTREKLSQLNARLNESLQGMTIIQAMRQEKRLRKEFGKTNGEHNHASLKSIKLNSLLLRPAVQVLYVLGLVLVLGFFGVRSFDSVISIGVIYAFVNYLDRFFEPVNSMMQQLTHFQQATVSAERVFGLLDETEMAPTKIGNSASSIQEGKIEFKNVTFSYDGKTDVLKNISFVANPGETVALVGHTGSGKSSIINLLMRFYPIEKGDITIDGTSLKAFSDEELRKNIGLVLQDPFIFAGDVKSNIRLNNRNISDEQIVEAAKFVQADSFIEKLPKTYDEPIGERGSTFSSGQRQLLSFARTMAIDPRILVLDEATANVDTETEEAIQTALAKMREGRTTIAIAHRLSTIQDADQILVLHKGEIVERGTHQELLAFKGLYHKMYLLQQGEVAS